MTDIVTLTMNPSIDVSVSVERLAPFHKLRCIDERRDPGGGGINVARVAKRLGAKIIAMYPVGGATGQLLRRFVDQEGIPGLTVPIAAETREDFTALERATGQQYRFILPGPELSETEWRGCLDTFGSLDQVSRFAVLSGSLPRGVPDDFYGRAAGMAKQANIKVVVDCSGAPLRVALQSGLYLIKPNLNELKSLTGEALESDGARIKACRTLIDSGQVEVVALTLGDQGALLVTHDRVLRAPELPIKPVSAVGAGDSFLGAMVWGLACGQPLETAFRYGMAAGSAALLMPGTELCRRQDVERLVECVKLQVI